jgi:murein DD-endopeptidase MepM/ murein hydrolase activator NlpD
MTIQLADIYQGNHPITQIFGVNPANYARFGLKGHNGIDFGMDNGTEIWSATNGVVLRAGDFTGTGWNGFGIMVEIWDDVQNCACIYGHLQSVAVKAGDRVHARQPIGRSNNTGNSTGPHLHFGVCKTDSQGVRLYTNNGFGGWLNASEPPTGPSDGTAETFHWTFTNQVWVPAPPVDPCAGDKAATAAALKLLADYKLSIASWSATFPK